MADYRAINRNSKIVDARKKLAAKFSTPAPKVNPNVVPQKPKDPAKYSAALREQAQRGVTGVRPLPTSDRNKFGIEEVFNPVVGVTGGAGLATTNYNPENIDYGRRTVPTIRGGMMSGGGPGIGSSFAGIGAALYGAATATPITEFDKKRYEKNPFSIRGSNLVLSPEQKREQANDQTDANRKKDYSDLLRTLKAAGLTEEELYRSAVASPDGRVNLNPNAQAAISQLGNAADSLRLLDVTGLGLGKPVAMGASFAGKQAVKQVSRGLDSLIARVAKIAPKVGRVAEDIAMAPTSMALAAGGFGGGNILRTTREATAAKAATYDIISFTPKELADINAAHSAGRPITKRAEDDLFLRGYLDFSMGRDTPLARIFSTRFPHIPVNNPSRVPLSELVDPSGQPIARRTASVIKRERRDIRRAGQEVTPENYIPPQAEELATNFQALQQAVENLDVNPIIYKHGVVTHSPSLTSLVSEGKPITSEVRSAGGDIPNWVQGAMQDDQFLERLALAAIASGDAKGAKAARELAKKIALTRKG